MLNECLTFVTKTEFNDFEEDLSSFLPHTYLFNPTVFTFALKMFILYEDANACFYFLFPVSTIQKICKQFENNTNNKLCSSHGIETAIFL